MFKILCLLLIVAPLYGQGIVLNPLGNTPLSAIYKIESTNLSPIIITVKGKDSSMDISVAYPPKYGMEFSIHGLYEDYENTIIIKEGSKAEINYKIQTEKIVIPKASKIGNDEIDKMIEEEVSFNVSLAKDTLPKSNPFNQDLYFLSLPLNKVIMALDRKGDMRYYYSDSKSMITVIRLEADDNNIYILGVDNFQYYQKTDLFGNIVFREPMSVHHEAAPYVRGQELILGNSQWGWEDVVFVLNKNKKINQTLFLGDAIRKVAHPSDTLMLNEIIYDDKNAFTNDSGRPQKVDWAHINSMVYDIDNHIAYFSARHIGVIAVSMTDWKMLWFMSADDLNIDEGFGYGAKPSSYPSLKDVPSLAPYRMNVKNPKDAPKGQHALFLKKNGNLMMFDNQGDDRINPEGSRVIEYKFDTSRNTAQVVREYSTPEKDYSRLLSDVDLHEENLLILYAFGRIRRIIEVNPQDEILFDLQIRAKVPFFRVDKFPLYPYSDRNKKYSLDYLEK